MKIMKALDMHQVMDMGAYEFAFQFLVAISSHNNNAKLLSAFK